jgi:hypothetical protein
MQLPVRRAPVALGGAAHVLALRRDAALAQRAQAAACERAASTS